MGELQPGQMLRTDSGLPCRVERFLAGGGQWEVYEANWSGKLFALKWYLPQTATPEQLSAIQALAKKGPPSEKFLWPFEMISKGGCPGFGYLMRLREPQFKGIIDMMK